MNRAKGLAPGNQAVPEQPWLPPEEGVAGGLLVHTLHSVTTSNRAATTSAPDSALVDPTTSAKPVRQKPQTHFGAS